MVSKSQVKYIQSLIEKKFRKEGEVFVAEGPKIINELLGSRAFELIQLYATDKWQATVMNERQPGSLVTPVSEAELKKISFLSTPNQVLGLFRQRVPGPVASFSNMISLLLDGIQDPGNLGTIIRIADWFGIQHIIASLDTADLYNPKVVQSTMGSIARVQVHYFNLDEFIGNNGQVPLYAATLQGAPVQSFGKIQECLLLIGNESKGVDKKLIDGAAYQVSIPSYGGAESLNAAVAAGIILSHFFTNKLK